MEKYLKPILISLFLIILVSCGKPDPAKERIKLIANPTGPVKIGVGWSFSGKNDRFLIGLNMALGEINAAGGILGRPVELVTAEDNAAVTHGRVVAQNFVNNPEIMAVIGHRKSYISLSCASLYEFGGLLMLTPKSTTTELTKKGYKHIFRMIPSNAIQGVQLAEYAAEKKYKRITIFYIKNDYGKDLANAFEQRAEEKGLEVVDRLSYTTPNNEYFRKVLSTWKNEYYFDAIFLAGQLPGAARFIIEARKMGIDVPIIGGDSLHSSKMISIAGESGEGIIAAAVFHPDDPRKEVKNFTARYKKKFKEAPTQDAALGYDSLRLIAHAMNTARTTDPSKVSTVIHSIKDWRGVTGIHTFNEKGDDIGMKIIKLVIRDNKFRYLE